MLALAVLPTVGKALAFWGADATRWAEVCTPQGVRLVAVQADAATGVAPGHPGAAVHLEHCALCLLAVAPALPPAAQQPGVPQLLGADLAPQAFLHAPRTLHAWRSAQPRGPPIQA